MFIRFLKDTVYLITGSIVFSIGFCIFALPNNLLTGGAGGLAMILNSLTGLAVGTGVLLINIPLLIWSLKICGRGYTIKTLYSISVFSTTIDLFEIAINYRFTSSIVISALCCGVFTGIGMYILLSRALVTGGSDLLAYLINKKNPKRAIGTLIFIIDTSIILMGAFIYKSVSSTVFSVVLIFVMSTILNFLLEKKIYVKLPKKHNRP